LFKDRSAFERALAKALKTAGLTLSTPVKKAILSTLAERDEDAPACVDKSGAPEPDAALRDHELVPLKEDWQAFVAREVTPFVPDAWVDRAYRDAADGGVGRVGYEINFSRFFFRHSPQRALTTINAELTQLELDIARLLKEVAL
jgi:type I restriction enzyme M protein